jgi:hypothetical protein
LPEPVVPEPRTVIEPAGVHAPAPSVPASLRAAAHLVLARDGRDYHLQPWQVAYLAATSEGRTGAVPPGCGVGKGWLQARLDEAVDTDRAD